MTASGLIACISGMILYIMDLRLRRQAKPSHGKILPA
jgi:hypothetical protein